MLHHRQSQPIGFSNSLKKRVYDKRLKGRKRRATTRINIGVILSGNLVNQFETTSPKKSFILL
jgi:hypothetical protein